MKNTFLVTCKNHPVPSFYKRGIPCVWDDFFSMQLLYPGKAGQNGSLDAYVKLVNTVSDVRSWNKE